MSDNRFGTGVVTSPKKQAGLSAVTATIVAWGLALVISVLPLSWLGVTVAGATIGITILPMVKSRKPSRVFRYSPTPRPSALCIASYFIFFLGLQALALIGFVSIVGIEIVQSIWFRWALAFWSSVAAYGTAETIKDIYRADHGDGRPVGENSTRSKGNE